MVLTERQKKDLLESVFEFFVSEGSNFTNTIEALRNEGKISTNTDAAKGVLEKKWTAIARLQKKIMDLETQISTLQQQNKSTEKVVGDGRILPRAPAKSTLSGHRAPITAITVHPIYTVFASGSEDSTIKMWDYETCQYERTLKGHTGPVTGISFDSSGNILASCSADMSAKLWDMTTYVCTKTLRGHDHTISSIRFAYPACDQVLTCSRDQTIKCWEVSSGFCVKTFSGHTDWVKCISVSLNGEMVASGGSDHSIIIWRMSTGQPVQTLRGHEHVVETLSYGKKPLDANAVLAVQSINTADSYSYLASGSRDKTVRLWDPDQGACLMVFTAHENWVRGVHLHENGKFIISCGDDKTIRIMDIKENRCLRTLADCHNHFVTCLSMSPISSKSNAILVTGSVDKMLSIWPCL